MSWRAALGEVLEQTALVHPEPDTEVVVRKKGPNVDMARTILDVPRTAVTVSVGRVDHPPGVKDGEWRQQCDHLIFAEWDGRNIVLLIELKRQLRGDRKPFDQIHRTRPIVEYLAEIGRMAGAPAGRLQYRSAVLADRVGAHVEKAPVQVAVGKPVWIREHEGMRTAVFPATATSLRRPGGASLVTIGPPVAERPAGRGFRVLVGNSRRQPSGEAGSAARRPTPGFRFGVVRVRIRDAGRVLTGRRPVASLLSR